MNHFNVNFYTSQKAPVLVSRQFSPIICQAAGGFRALFPALTRGQGSMDPFSCACYYIRCTSIWQSFRGCTFLRLHWQSPFFAVHPLVRLQSGLKDIMLRIRTIAAGTGEKEWLKKEYCCYQRASVPAIRRPLTLSPAVCVNYLQTSRPE